MSESCKLFQIISTIERRHGLSSLDPSAREILDLIISRELDEKKSTASDLISGTKISRAAVYRKIKELKNDGWIDEQWHEFRLCYVANKKLQSLSEELSLTLKPSS